MLRDRGREQRRAQAHERGLVGSGDDDDGARHPFRAEILLDELAQFAAAFADERDHVHVASAPRAIIPSSVDFPTPLPAKMPRRWPRPIGVKTSIARTPVWNGRLICCRSSGFGGRFFRPRVNSRPERAALVDRLAEPVDHAAEQAVADRHRAGERRRHHLAAGVDIIHLAERHEQNAVIAKTDHLRHRLRSRRARD